MFNVLQPPGWAPAKGYANGIEARGRQVFVAGMIGWNGQCQFETDDFVAQCRPAPSGGWRCAAPRAANTWPIHASRTM